MKRIVRIVVLVLFVVPPLQAQNAKEAMQNTKQIVEGKEALQRDMKELEAFKRKLTTFNSAFNGKNVKDVNTIKMQIVADMAREVQQSNIKAKNARRELSQSSAEVRSDRREIRRNKNDSDRGRYDRKDDDRDMARDRANSRDDRRDRRDDVRDLEQQIERAKRQEIIFNKVNQYSFGFGKSEMSMAETNKKLILEFVSLLNEDVEATKRELAEDNRERREDRRERRDDRQERNEISSKRRFNRG